MTTNPDPYLDEAKPFNHRRPPVADPLPELGWHHAHAWLPLRADQVQAGDVYANWGTVIALHHGPTLPPASTGDLAEGEVRIECGETFATTGRGTRLVIVGRRIAEVPTDG